MKISIDTKEDSHEHIKHVISMLNGIIGNSIVVQDEKKVEEPQSNVSGLMNLFSDDTSKNTEFSSVSQETPFFNIFAEDNKTSNDNPIQHKDDLMDQPPIQMQQPSVKVETPERDPPKNAPPDIDIFKFFNKTGENKDNSKFKLY